MPAGTVLLYVLLQLDPIAPEDRQVICELRLQRHPMMNGIEALTGVEEGPRELMVSSQKGADVSSGSAAGTSKMPASAGPARRHVLVTVHDTGPGLDSQGLERLFEAFYTTKPHGLGLGLTICRSIIQAHGGQICVRANAPRGAVFEFALPIRE